MNFLFYIWTQKAGKILLPKFGIAYTYTGCTIFKRHLKCYSITKIIINYKDIMWTTKRHFWISSTNAKFYESSNHTLSILINVSVSNFLVCSETVASLELVHWKQVQVSLFSLLQRQYGEEHSKYKCKYKILTRSYSRRNGGWFFKGNYTHPQRRSMQVYYSGPVQLQGIPHRYYIPLKFTPHLQYHEFFMPPNRTRIILFSTSRYNTILDAQALRSVHVIRK